MSMRKLDTTWHYETPEGIILKLKIAGPVARAFAWLMDFLIRIGAYIVLSLILTFLDKTGWGIMLILFFLIEWFYPVFFEVRSGATPGKKMIGLSVIHYNGTPIHITSSLLRNLLRAADFFPFCYGAGLVTMLINRDFKRLGDIAAGTLVVYKEKSTDRYNLKQQVPKKPPSGLKVKEQQAILDLAERSENLSGERCVELAEILTDLTGKQGKAAVEDMYAYASWLSEGK